MSAVLYVQGWAFHLPGDSIDTDRIIPARHLKLLEFRGLEKFAFEDARENARARGEIHPFDDEQNIGASILVVDNNFGCGSSREHAVQCIIRRGIKAVIGLKRPGSPGFAAIFRGNAAANGVPCLDLTEEDHARLLDLMRVYPRSDFKIDMAARTVVLVPPPTIDAMTVVEMPFEMPADHHERLVSGKWDTINVLLEAGEQIEATMSQLPYTQEV